MSPPPSTHQSIGQSLSHRRKTLIESTPRDVKLTVGEAKALVALGRSLALTTAPTAEDEDHTDRSLIRCTMNPDGRWRVLVSDAVGLISVGDLRIVVEPKIPRTHLFHLFSRSELMPRLAPMETVSAEGEHLWELVCRWFLDAVEQVLRRDLVRDYFPFRDTLAVARGEIEPLATADQYYRGSLHLACAYEEFEADTEPNRVLKAAAEAVMASVDAADRTRRRARRVTARMEGAQRITVMRCSSPAQFF
jgi:McrBC 5-methylcytosine restriction system component